MTCLMWLIVRMLLMFADDTNLYQTMTSVHDSNALQQDIDNISAWGEQSLMSFNIYTNNTQLQPSVEPGGNGSICLHKICKCACS